MNFILFSNQFTMNQKWIKIEPFRDVGYDPILEPRTKSCLPLLSPPLTISLSFVDSRAFLWSMILKCQILFPSGELYQGWGSCSGDSGGPLMKERTDKAGRFYQIGVLHGGVSECGNSQYPNIYARLEDPEILSFVLDMLGKLVSATLTP